jgi:CRISPR-associated protein Cas1
VTKVFLNTLFVGTQDAYIHLENDQVFVLGPRAETTGDDEGTGKRPKLLAVPLHHLGSIVLFGRVSASFPLMARCADDGRCLTLMTEYGRFRARVQGKTSGNVLLRKAQYDYCTDPDRALDCARRIVAGKLQNARQVLLRATREAKAPLVEAFAKEAEAHRSVIESLPMATTMDGLRGAEGIAAQGYFDVFDAMVTQQRADFRFEGRSRRPPRDRTNALLSLLYSLWTNDCVAALEGVGLDPQFGILHVLRPGRPALALDLVEEFRSIVLDRLCLSLINLRQVTAKDFVVRDGGSVLLSDEGRKKVLVAYQKRKQQEVGHALLKEKVAIGLLPHIQARLLARVFRGDLPHYVPYSPA